MSTKLIQCIAPVTLVAALATAGCQSNANQPRQGVAHQQALASSSDGQYLYMTKCGDCHRLHAINEFPISEWKSILNAMAPLAKLSADQKNAVFSYISSGAAVSR